MWHRALDPAILDAHAQPADPRDPDAISLTLLRRWLTVVEGANGKEHAVLSDGCHHLRIDVEAGRIGCEEAVILEFRLRGLRSAAPRLLALRRLLGLCRHRRFVPTLFPADPRLPRLVAMLRVADALADGASQRQIAATMFGAEAVTHGWDGRTDALRSRMRRLVRDARAMRDGGYRRLLGGKGC